MYQGSPKKPWMLEAVPDYFKMKEMCNDVFKKMSWGLERLKTQKMCNDATNVNPGSL